MNFNDGAQQGRGFCGSRWDTAILEDDGGGMEPHSPMALWGLFYPEEGDVGDGVNQRKMSWVLWRKQNPIQDPAIRMEHEGCSCHYVGAHKHRWIHTDPGGVYVPYRKSKKHLSVFLKFLSNKVDFAHNGFQICVLFVEE